MNNVPETRKNPSIGDVNRWLTEGMLRSGADPAVVHGSEVCSHAELNTKSSRIASYLAEKGVGPGSSVGLCMDRSIEMVAALIGILKAGAAYVPLDPYYPSERLSMMMEDAKLSCLLCHKRHEQAFEPLLVWEEVADEIAACPDMMTAVSVDPEHLAYIIFTSGSTGRPKGIAMPHRALVNLIEWQLKRSSFKNGARVLQYSSISFDVSFQEVATTIASGGTLYLISNDDRKDPRKLLAQLVEQEIERLFLPYVALRSMVEAAHATGTYPEALKEIITAGEQLRIDHAVRDFFSRTGASLDNQYGPSETHVITAYLLEGNSSDWPELPSIGTPLQNCGTYILNAVMQPVKAEEAGELYLAGCNLAHGYVGRDDLTQQAFVANPFNMDEWPVLYKTGDLASYKSDGTILFLGRRDQQIKIRGHRVESGEINNTASEFPGVEQCFTRAFDGGAGILQLTTYYTVTAGLSVNESLLRKHLSMKLPDYMQPAFLIPINELPYTPSGKIDLKLLPKPSIQNSQYADEKTEYHSVTEATLARIWSELLGLDGIPRVADFFELGGDSLRAVTLFLKISKQFGKELPLTTLAEASTIAALAEVIDGVSAVAVLSGCRSLQMIHQGNDDVVPLFLIHGGMGNTLVFNTLVRHLEASQPVYAFQWSGWDGFPGETTLESMAKAYKKELLQICPVGPVRLGGYCIGGLIAVELARILRTDGIEVLEPLFILDSPNPHSSSYHLKEPWEDAGLMCEYESLKKGLLSRSEPFSPTQSIQGQPEPPSYGLTGALKKIPGLRRWVRWMRWMSVGYPVLMARLQHKRIPMEIRGEYCLRKMKIAVQRHRSSGYPGNVLYFRSHSTLARAMGLSGWWYDPFMGFRELCGGEFDYHVVGSTHSSMIEVPEIGTLMTRSIEKKQIGKNNP